MRWSVVRLIAAKEFRDLLRDRRTVLLILVLPAVLYPVFGAGGWLMAVTLLGQKQTLAVVGAEHLPAPDSGFPTFPPDDPDPAAAAAGDPAADLPPPGGPVDLTITPMAGDPDDLLRTRRADAVLVVPPGFAADLRDPAAKPTVTVKGRDGDDKSKIAVRRLTGLVRAWEKQLRQQRFEAKGLPKDFDKVLTVVDPQTEKPKLKRTADELRDSFARVFPFILMMWLVAGAIQPAVDMTAGEKERGTMETLLISPAERGEIVAGKFLATTGFAFGSVVWNVLWLTGAAVLVQQVLGFPILNPAGVVACVVLGLPLAMLFAAVCLALGVFAQSTKEGQYYLLPLILVTMPLAFYGMMPGSELTPGNCWVPVTGAILLQAKLLAVTGEPLAWWAFPAVLGSLAGWVAVALGLAAWQFRREAVLFREAQAGGKGLKGLFGGRG
jgi:sodium transport system permease protein